MRSDLPRDPIFVLEHKGEPPILRDVPLSGKVTFSGYQMDMNDQKLIAFCVNFLDNMRYIDNVSVKRRPGVPPVASLSTSRAALSGYLGDGGGDLECLSESLGRVMTARLRFDAADHVFATSLFESFCLYKNTDAVVIRVNMNAVHYYKKYLGALMQVEL